MKKKKKIKTKEPLGISVENRCNYDLHEFIPSNPIYRDGDDKQGLPWDNEPHPNELVELWNDFVVKEIYECGTEQEVEEWDYPIEGYMENVIDRIWKNEIHGRFLHYLELKGIDGKLSNIEKLLELLLTPPDLVEYKKWKLTKRKGIN